jgi:hypothetical protein
MGNYSEILNSQEASLCDILGVDSSALGRGEDSDRIVGFKLADDKRTLHIIELCDGHFSMDMTPEDVDKLIAFIQAKRAEMIIDQSPTASPVLEIYPPDDDGDHWTVSGDCGRSSTWTASRLRYEESINYAVQKRLIEEGWPAVEFDSEYSCFFGYVDTEERARTLQSEATRLAETLRTWAS